VQVQGELAATENIAGTFMRAAALPKRPGRGLRSTRKTDPLPLLDDAHILRPAP